MHRTLTSGEARRFAEEHSEILPGFQILALESAVRGVEANRHMAGEALEIMPSGDFDVDDAWPPTWIPMFVDGGGFQFALDCQRPEQPSALRMCFRDDFSGPNWGQIVCASISGWIRNGLEWMRHGPCRYDAQRRNWRPRSAFDNVWPRFEPR